MWREYLSDGQIKGQTMKVVKPTPQDASEGYVDVNGKPSYMNCETGVSKVKVIIPAKTPAGLNGTIVLDNGSGMATGSVPD